MYEEKIISIVEDLKKGKIIERENRFILKVKFNSNSKKVYLANTGSLKTVIESGREILCKKANGSNRKTKYDAFAIKVNKIYVTVNSNLANLIFLKVLDKNLLEKFTEYNILSKEPKLPAEGKADFLLKKNRENIQSYVEVKSCTYVKNGIAKFPDRPTKRGRRHIENLTALEKEGYENHVVFVVQREDAKKFQPFREVDPKFADLLIKAKENGVNISVISTKFEPPNIYLHKKNLPINFA